MIEQKSDTQKFKGRHSPPKKQPSIKESIMNKYQELQHADQVTEKLFNDYKDDCRNFISRMRKKLADYLGCEITKITWVTFSDKAILEAKQQDGFLEHSLDKKMILFDDAFYTFFLGIMLSPDSLIPPNGVHLKFKVKKTNEYFVVRHDQDFTLREGNTEDWEVFLDSVFDSTKNYLKNRFEKFIKGEKSTFGFLTHTSKS
jgi:hypothetical protein